MNPGGVFAFLHVARSLFERDPLDRPTLGTAPQVQLLLAPQFRFLRGKSVAMNRRLGRPADGLNKSEIGQARPFLEEIFVCKGRESEILPPDRFLFPPVPVEDIGEDPTR